MVKVSCFTCVLPHSLDLATLNLFAAAMLCCKIYRRIRERIGFDVISFSHRLFIHIASPANYVKIEKCREQLPRVDLLEERRGGRTVSPGFLCEHVDCYLAISTVSAAAFRVYSHLARRESQLASMSAWTSSMRSCLLPLKRWAKRPCFFIHSATGIFLSFGL